MKGGQDASFTGMSGAASVETVNCYQISDDQKMTMVYGLRSWIIIKEGVLLGALGHLRT